MTSDYGIKSDYGSTSRLISTAEAARLLGVSRSTVYRLLKAGALVSVRVGRSRRIPVTALARYLDPEAGRPS